MINSLFMLGSSLNKKRKISAVFMVFWIAYVVIKQFSPGNIFPIINIAVFLAVTISINAVKNKKVNLILSIFSILIWSIAIDIICYYIYPLFSSNQSVLGYVWQGIIYNFKYVMVNMTAACAIYGIEALIKNTRALPKLKECR